MDFERIPPPFSLQPFVRCYWVFEVRQDEIPYRQLFFPYGSHELIFFLKAPALMRYLNSDVIFPQPKSFYSGQFTRPFELSFAEPCYCAGISFHPWTGNLLYNIPADKFADQMVSIDILEKDSGIAEKLADAESKEKIFRHFTEYLEARLLPKTTDDICRWVATALLNQHTSKNTEALAMNDIGLSQRRVQQRFLEATGLPMRSFLKKVRFQKSLNMLQTMNEQVQLTQVAYDSGYYDQAHFIRDFKHFTGLAPLEYKKQASEMKQFIQSLMPA